MDGFEISARLKRRGVAQADLARELRVSPSIVSNVVHNRATCFAVAQRIADVLGIAAEELWPGRYVFRPRERRAVKRLTPNGTGKERPT